MRSCLPTKTKPPWSEELALNPLGCDRQTAKRAVQRVVALPHQPEISAADDAAIHSGFRAFTDVKMIDPDQRNVVAPNRFDTTVHHRLSPLDTVRLDLGAVQVEAEQMASLVDDCLTAFCLRRPLPDSWTDPDDATRRIPPITCVRKLPDEPLVPANTDHVRQVRHVVSVESEFDPLSDLLHCFWLMDGQAQIQTPTGFFRLLHAMR